MDKFKTFFHSIEQKVLYNPQIVVYTMVRTMKGGELGMTYTVKQARQYAGLTQCQMAEKMGICRSSYRKIELNPELATVKQAKDISAITGVAYDLIIFTQ